MKVCSKCKKEKMLSEFYKNAGRKNGVQSECKDCHKERVAKYQKDKPEACRERNKRYYRSDRGYYSTKIRRLKMRYGITEDEYRALLDNQKGCCGVCGDSLGKVALDHNHDTGKVRGILCTKCNTGLGKLGDNKEGLLKALTYLERTDG